MTRYIDPTNGALVARPRVLILPNGRVRTGDYPDTDLLAAGYQVAPAAPEHDPETQQVVWNTAERRYDLVDRPSPPEPVPQELEPLAFQALVQQTAGLTDADVLAAMKDPALELMWMRLGMARVVRRDTDMTTGGLAALVATGHITEEERGQIIADWPVDGG